MNNAPVRGPDNGTVGLLKLTGKPRPGRATGVDTRAFKVIQGPQERYRFNPFASHFDCVGAGIDERGMPSGTAV